MIEYEADELLGRKATTIYTNGYTNLQYDGDMAVIFFKCKNHVFADGFAKCGIYGKDGNLIAMTDRWLNFPSDDRQTVTMYNSVGAWKPSFPFKFDGNIPKAKNVYEYILHGDGYVRFILNEYGGGIYEEKVPCFGLEN